jgi:hypothetical protein
VAIVLSQGADYAVVKVLKSSKNEERDYENLILRIVLLVLKTSERTLDRINHRFLNSLSL